MMCGWSAAGGKSGRRYSILNVLFAQNNHSVAMQLRVRLGHLICALNCFVRNLSAAWFMHSGLVSLVLVNRTSLILRILTLVLLYNT